MARILLLLCFALSSWCATTTVDPYRWDIGLQGNAAVFDRSLGMGGNPGAALVDQATSLSSLPETYTRPTSGYNPATNTITGAGVRRQKTQVIGTVTYNSDLIEGARTNLLAAGSEHFELSTLWTPGGLTGVTMNAAAPDGTTTACTFVEDSALTSHRVLCATITKAASALPYSTTVYAKRSVGTRNMMIEVYNAAFTNGANVIVDLSTGAVLAGGPTVVGTFTAATARVVSEAGFWRITLMVTSDTDVALKCFLSMMSGTSNNYTGDGVSSIIFSWPQVEQAPFPSSYISNRNLRLQTLGMTTSWTQTDITPTANAAAHPVTGLTNVTLMTEGSAGTAVVAQTATIIAGNTFTSSTYLKRGNTDWIRYQELSGGADGFRIWVNVNTGAIGTTSVIGTGTYTSSSITAVGAFWRLTVTGKVAAASTAPVVNINSASADASNARVTGATYYLASHQLEYGSVASVAWDVSTAVGLREADSLTVSLASITDARINQLSCSEQFDNGTWNSGTPTIVANAATDPNGNAYADNFTAGRLFQEKAPANGPFTFFVYLKALSGSPSGTIQIKDRATDNVQGSSTVTLSSSAWTRLVCSGTTAGASTGFRVEIGLPTGGASVFGACVVNGLVDPGASAYLPTSVTPVTAPQTGLSTTSGTLITIAQPYGWGVANSVGVTFRLNDSGTSGWAGQYFNGSNYEPVRQDSVTTRVTDQAASPASGTNGTYGVTWSPAGVQGYLNGVGSTVNATTTAPWTGPTSIVIGANSAGSQVFYGWVLPLYWHNRVLSASEEASVYQVVAP